MTSHASDDERDEAEGSRRIKVTDKRRVRDDEAPAAQDEGPAAPVDAGDAAEGGDDDRDEAVGTGDADELAAATRQAAEYRDHLQRLAADFDNYRKRVLKEQTHAVEMAAEPLVRRLLEVLDEFDLALMAAERRPEFEQFLHGVELVYAKLLDILRAEGLERIEAKGRPFDPERHEALMQSGDGDGAPYVADVLRQGYELKGRVIRPAGVKVARS
jgi:molecular chaperone GrpE